MYAGPFVRHVRFVVFRIVTMNALTVEEVGPFAVQCTCQASRQQPSQTLQILDFEAYSGLIVGPSSRAHDPMSVRTMPMSLQ